MKAWLIREKHFNVLKFYTKCITLETFGRKLLMLNFMLIYVYQMLCNHLYFQSLKNLILDQTKPPTWRGDITEQGITLPHYNLKLKIIQSPIPHQA
jgi:hypothetical protein